MSKSNGINTGRRAGRRTGKIRYCKDAGIKTNDKITQHCLRKSWACNLADNGVPAHTLMSMGGWSSIETVQQFYLKTSDANEKKAVEMLDRLMEEETFRA